ncbi:MAG TPA: hypothetical protein VKY51_01690 [Fredinandcohnia sp.]|nr:hypothetical protein [Fredinandcohnia sp.]
MRKLVFRWKKSPLGREDGQGMTEYVIIVALVAIAAIGVVTAFGDNVRNLFATSTEALAGKASSSSGVKTVDDGLRKSRDLQDFASEAKKRR